MVFASLAGAQDTVRLYAAGSLRAAIGEIAAVYEAAGQAKVAATFGASGLLRGRIEKGEAADVFASADIGNPRRLEAAGRAGAVRTFARNQLCALASPAAAASTENVLERMLDPRVRLGTSTPKADPSGDYAWELFRKADALRPGAFAALSAKARQLVGGPDSPLPPGNRSVYGWMMEKGEADLFLTYCTNARQARSELPRLEVVALPGALAVGAEYGIAVVSGAGPAAQRFVDFILSPTGQEILERHGFGRAS